MFVCGMGVGGLSPPVFNLPINVYLVTPPKISHTAHL